MTPLSLEKRKKSHGARVGRVGRLLQHGDVLLGQELPDAQGSVSRRVVMVKHPRVVLPQLLPLLAHWTKQMLQYLFVDMLVDRLALWQELAVDDAPHIEECDQHDFVTMELRRIMEESFQECMQTWQRRMGKCVRLQGDYFEGDNL